MHLVLLWHMNAGGEINADSHGDVNIGVQAGPYSLELQTDTIDARWSPSGEHGRSWIGARFASFAAQMVISPWTDGAPDPSRGLNAQYAGLDAGAIRYFSEGSYGGAQIAARYFLFQPRDLTTVPQPPPRPVLSPELLLGIWRPTAELRLTVGFDWSPETFAPHLNLYAHVLPATRFAPLAELRLGVAEGQDWLTTTRIGGLNPYVVPLAGAAWAEFRAEDYAAARVGVIYQKEWKVVSLKTGPVMDLVWFQGEEVQPEPAALVASAPRTELGFAWRNHLGFKRSFADLDVGVAPWLPRQPGIGAWSIWFRVGTEWGKK